MKFRSISTKHIVNMLFILILFGILILFFVRFTVSNTLMNSLKEKGLSICKQIAITSVEPILIQDNDNLLKILNENKNTVKDISYIFIIDEDGNVLSHTFNEGFPFHLLWANKIPLGDHSSIKLLRLDNELVFDVAVPMEVDNYILGITHVGISLRAIKTTLRKIEIRTILTIVIFILIGVFISFQSAKKIITPIKKLQQITDLISETENLEHSIIIKSGDETENLANSFEEMRRKLKQSKENIEEKIDERTYELKSEIRERERKENELNTLTQQLKDTNKELEKSQFAALNIMEDLKDAKVSLEKEKSKLIEQKKELQRVNKELDNFVYIASHDLRAPLRGISSFASFLFEDYESKLEKEGIEFINQIKASAGRMDTLLTDLLTISRISRTKNPLEDTDINKVLEKIIKRLEFDIKEHKVKIKIQKDIPVIYCDKIKIAQVFSNLIDNAIKYTIKERKHPKIEVGYSEEDDEHCFFVKDNGIGIDEEYTKKIFDPFIKLHAQHEYKGTGVGLNIADKIIEEHLGKIWIKSKLGKGSTFYFTISKHLKNKNIKGEDNE